MKKVIFILLFIPFLLSAQTTKYVAPDGSGDDDAAGDVATPWATLAYAVTQVTTAEDTIYMQAGTHTINTTVTLPLGVSLRGAGETSIITTTSISAEYATVISLKSESLADGNQAIRNLKFDGNSQTGATAIWMTRRNGVKIHDCTFIDWNYLAVYLAGDGGNASTPPTNYITGIEFYNNTITNSSAYTGGYARGALYFGGTIGMLIHDNNISQTGRTAGQNGWPIKIEVNGGWTKGLKIYDNVLFKDDLTYWDFAIEGFFQYGTEIYGNTITGSVDLNHTEKGDYDYGLYIHNNTLGPETATSDNWHGMILEFNSKDIIIKYNLFRNCHEGIYYTPRTGNLIDNNIIAYNIFDDLGKGGGGTWGAIRMWQDVEGSYTLGTYEVYNNVFFANAANPTDRGIGITGYDTGTEISIINNIFINFDMYWAQFRWSDRLATLNIKNNILYNNANSNNPYFDSDEYPTSYTISDTLKRNPLFTAANDYTLQAESPAIDAGLGVGLNYDYLGNPVGASPDIGAYEVQDIDSTATDILTFTFADIVGSAVINTTDHTVTASAEYESGLTTITPTITMDYGATISPTSGTEEDFTAAVTYTVTALDGTTTQEWAITITEVNPSTNTGITSFSLAEQTKAATINATTHTVAIEVEIDTDVSALTPTIGVYSGATISPLSGVEQDFTSPVVYTVTAQDTETTQEWTVTVTEADELAVVTTSAVATTTRTGIGTGNITNDGGSTVTSRGICWSTSVNPTTSSTVNYRGTGTGSFTGDMRGLLPSTTYHVRAFAINNKGTSYGENKTFTTPDVSPVVNSGKVYRYNGKTVIY